MKSYVESRDVCLKLGFAIFSTSVIDCRVVAEGGGGLGAVLELGEGVSGVRVRLSTAARLATSSGSVQGVGGVTKLGGGLVLLLAHVLLPGADPHGHPLLVAGGPVALDSGHHIGQAFSGLSSISRFGFFHFSLLVVLAAPLLVVPIIFAAIPYFFGTPFARTLPSF